jgi:hypothetical protein
VGVPRFVGYSEQRPYLLCVDFDDRTIEPAAELRTIPQAVSEIIPLDAAVAVRCGLDWFALEADLSGKPRPLSTDDLHTAQNRSKEVDVGTTPGEPDATLYWRGEPLAEIGHPSVLYWHEFATLSPDNRTVAVAGSLVPWPQSISVAEMLSTQYRETSSVLALVDVDTGSIRVCSGTFDNFCRPTWSADGDLIAFDAPFDRPTRLHIVRVEEGVVRPVQFKQRVPAPLLDVVLLPTA